MAINFLNDVSFNKNEIIQPVLENQINDTAAGTPVDGQLYYDTTNNVVKYGEGGSWEALATGGGTVTSIGITETGNALTITNSPITSSGNINIAGAGTTSQYIRGDLSLATFPSIPTVNDSTITLTMGNGLSSSSGSFTLNQGSNETFTFTVGEGTGITVNSGSVAIDYVGTDNAILEATAATPASADQLWFNDDDDDTIKRATIADIVALAPQGDITALTEGAGITITNATGPVPTVAVDYAGTDNVILEATDDSGSAVGTSDKIMTSNNSTNAVEYHNVSDLPFTNNAGDITAVVAGSGLTGGATSGSATLNVGAGPGIQVNADTVQVDYTTTNNIIDSAPDGSTIVSSDKILYEDATDTTVKEIAVSSLLALAPQGDLTGLTEGTYISISSASGPVPTINALGTEAATASRLVARDSNGFGYVATPSSGDSSTKIATTAFVQNTLVGLLEFKGGFDADGGAIDGGGNLTSGGSRVAVAVGDMYVVTGAGDFFGNTATPLTVGDSVICQTAASAGTSVEADFIVVQSDTDLATASTVGIGNVNQGTGITVSYSSGTATVTNSDRGSSQNIFKNFAASTGGTATANSNNDTLTLAAGTNITTTRSGDTITIASTDQFQGTVTSVGIAEGYLTDVSMNSGSNPITSAGQFLIDVDLSELTDMGATLASSDEAVILDVTETGKDQAKRITWAEVISDLNIATGSIPTVNNATITLAAGAGLDVSADNDFTLNQSGNQTITFSAEDSSSTNKGIVIVAPGEGIDVSYASGTATVSGEDSTASNKGIVIVSGGTGIDVSYSSGTATVSATSGSTGGFSGALTSATSGIARAEAGGITTFTLTTATLFGTATNSRQCIVEVMDGTTYATVYPEVARAATTTIEVKFKGTVNNDDYDISIVHAGSN
jgi:hypothetical protein